MLLFSSVVMLSDVSEEDTKTERALGQYMKKTKLKWKTQHKHKVEVEEQRWKQSDTGQNRQKSNLMAKQQTTTHLILAVAMFVFAVVVFPALITAIFSLLQSKLSRLHVAG